MNINATFININLICKRELWLHSHGITMEHNSDLVAQGKWIGENSYEQRANKNEELEVSVVYKPEGFREEISLNAKIDFFDAKKGIVHETKKSDAYEEAHRAQVLFYLFVLQKSGVNVTKGIIEYPKQRETVNVELNDEAEKEVKKWIIEVLEIVESESCPPSIKKSKCRNCSYFDFCWSGE